MPFAACQTQTLNKNNKDTHYKNKHPHPDTPTNPNKETTDQQTVSHPPPKDPGVLVRAMLASTIQKSNNKKPTSLSRPIQVHRVLMSQNPNSVLENPPPDAATNLPRRHPPRRAGPLQY